MLFINEESASDFNDSAKAEGFKFIRHNSRIDKVSIERTYHCITSAMEAIVEDMYVSQNTTHRKSRYFTSFKERIIEEKAPIKKSLFKKL